MLGTGGGGGGREDDALYLAHVCLSGAQIQVHKSRVRRRGCRVQSLTAASARCLCGHLSPLVEFSWQHFYSPFSSFRGLQLSRITGCWCSVLTDSVCEASYQRVAHTVSDLAWKQSRMQMLSCMIHSQQERWSGSHGGRWFLYVCVLPCLWQGRGWLVGSLIEHICFLLLFFFSSPVHFLFNRCPAVRSFLCFRLSWVRICTWSLPFTQRQLQDEEKEAKLLP